MKSNLEEITLNPQQTCLVLFQVEDRGCLLECDYHIINERLEKRAMDRYMYTCRPVIAS